MHAVISLMNPEYWVLTIAIGILAGVVKGTVGFAMPMIMISGLSSFLAPELALAALIVPTVASNFIQALRGGLVAALASIRNYRRFLIIFLVVLAACAQLVQGAAPRVMFLSIGIPITLATALQLVGWRPRVRQEHKRLVELLAATLAGFTGGFGGVWGPPTTAYLTAIETEKKEQVRVQGVIYALGAVILFLAHLKSGVLNSTTFQLSMWLLIPTMGGMFIGLKMQDRLDQERFRKLTLAVLVIAGLNLIRRGVWA